MKLGPIQDQGGMRAVKVIEAWSLILCKAGIVSISTTTVRHGNRRTRDEGSKGDRSMKLGLVHGWGSVEFDNDSGA